jgi:hypothetical protein
VKVVFTLFEQRFDLPHKSIQIDLLRKIRKRKKAQKLESSTVGCAGQIRPKFFSAHFLRDGFFGESLQLARGGIILARLIMALAMGC